MCHFIVPRHWDHVSSHNLEKLLFAFFLISWQDLLPLWISELVRSYRCLCPCVWFKQNLNLKRRSPKLKLKRLFFVFCFFLLQNHGQRLLPPRWTAGDLPGVFTPAGCTALTDNCPTSVGSKGFLPDRELASVWSAVGFRAFVCSSLGWGAASYSQPLSRCWWWCEVSSSGAGLASRGPSRGEDGNFCVMNDFARIELTRVTELIESLGGLTGRLNIGPSDWALNALTINWLCRHFFLQIPNSPLTPGSSILTAFLHFTPA